MVPEKYGKIRDYLIEVGEEKYRWDYEKVMRDCDRWGETHSFHFVDFSEIDKLVELKREKQLKISLGIPTLNEGKTIGNIVKVMKDNLMTCYPLLDEIAVIDSGSEDKTKYEARNAGAKFYLAEKNLKRYGDFKGKGENLWKSLYMLDGDLIVWIDGDIENPHEKFVYGLVGPLLEYPNKKKSDIDIKIVIPSYKRPLKSVDEEGKNSVSETGGGRVTEIMGRPMIDILFPILANIKQPFGGECAGRRDTLEQLPFHTGYPIEMARLIDVTEKFGLGAIAQTYLVRRIHRNQDTYALSKMSSSILKMALKRAEELGLITMNVEIDESFFRRASRDPDAVSLDGIVMNDHVRPPIIEIPEYKKKFKG